jgi:hypothetical protein
MIRIMDINKESDKNKIKPPSLSNEVKDVKKEEEKVKENNEQKQITCTLISGEVNYII